MCTLAAPYVERKQQVGECWVYVIFVLALFSLMAKERQKRSEATGETRYAGARDKGAARQEQ